MTDKSVTDSFADDARFFRDERAARQLPSLVPVVAQDVQEGYRLVTPSGTLTEPVEYVQWLDNHPAGPDTHVLVCFEGANFEDGSALEFAFDVALHAVWYREDRHLAPEELNAVIPQIWGTPVDPSQDY